MYGEAVSPESRPHTYRRLSSLRKSPPVAYVGRPPQTGQSTVRRRRFIQCVKTCNNEKTCGYWSKPHFSNPYPRIWAVISPWASSIKHFGNPMRELRKQRRTDSSPYTRLQFDLLLGGETRA